MYELKLKDRSIKLKWGIWAMREFCSINNITLEKYFEYLQSSQFDLDVIIKLVYIGYQSACLSQKEEITLTEVEICDYLDEIGSIFTENSALLGYLKYIIDNTVNSATQSKSKEEKKKSK